MSPAGRRPTGGRAVDVIVIGAGHSGLAMSAWLAAHSIEHVVLERGEIANSWRHERWDSLRLLTPNWLTRLPGYHYQDEEPDGFMSAADVAQFIARYARFLGAPVRTGTAVRSVRQHANYFRVLTERPQTPWRKRSEAAAAMIVIVTSRYFSAASL